MKKNPSIEFYKHNYEVYKKDNENYRKLLKKLIKSIPKSELVILLKEMKIIKTNYETNTLEINKNG